MVALARDDWDTETYRHQAAKWLDDRTASFHEALVAMLEYHRADVSDREEVARALGPLCEPIFAYLALPSAVFAPAIETLSGVGLPEGSRIALEKPFGEDLASAQNLNRLLHPTFS